MPGEEGDPAATSIGDGWEGTLLLLCVTAGKQQAKSFRMNQNITQKALNSTHHLDHQKCFTGR